MFSYRLLESKIRGLSRPCYRRLEVYKTSLSKEKRRRDDVSLCLHPSISWKINLLRIYLRSNAIKLLNNIIIHLSKDLLLDSKIIKKRRHYVSSFCCGERIRTTDHQIMRLVSYHCSTPQVDPAGLEPTTPCLLNRCSSQLS